MSGRQHTVAALCAALAVVSLTIVTSAQDVSGPNLKAAYIYRFALFTEWPIGALPQAGPLTMCVVGDTAVRDALERAVRGVTVAGRTVVVAFGQPNTPPAQCHMLYVSAVSSAQAARVVGALREVPVLTISDLEGFNRMGGIAEFFYEAGQLRFAIEPEAVERSRLRLSSRLLQLSRPPR
jgi:hypothetical protein